MGDRIAHQTNTNAKNYIPGTNNFIYIYFFIYLLTALIIRVKGKVWLDKRMQKPLALLWSTLSEFTLAYPAAFSTSL